MEKKYMQQNTNIDLFEYTLQTIFGGKICFPSRKFLKRGSKRKGEYFNPRAADNHGNVCLDNGNPSFRPIPYQRYPTYYIISWQENQTIF